MLSTILRHSGPVICDRIVVNLAADVWQHPSSLQRSDILFDEKQKKVYLWMCESVYSLSVSNFLMIVSIRVVLGATWPRRTGILWFWSPCLLSLDATFGRFGCKNKNKKQTKQKKGQFDECSAWDWWLWVCYECLFILRSAAFAAVAF